MSDAKKCDRCGGYYMMGVDNGIRPSCDGVRIFGVRYISARKQNLGEHDLCPDCAEMVWKYISEYDEPTEGEGADAVYADNETGYDMGIDLKPHKKRIVTFEVTDKYSS